MKNNKIKEIVRQSEFTKDDIVTLLSAKGNDRLVLFEKSAEVKKESVSNITYFRGLVEFSNICSKSCYYCGIRKDNIHVNRYNLDDDAILEAVKFAHEHNYGSLVLQSGERCDKIFTSRITKLLQRIHRETGNSLHITLSLGEQHEQVYKEWLDNGAHRYLLRIETTSKQLYQKMHPSNALHHYEKRLSCLKTLQRIGYQTGTGVMIGLPFQTIEDLANDLLFMKKFDIDMVGMGPYIEHKETPLYQYRDFLLPLEQRFELALKMIAVLRIMMKDINIAAATALQAIDKVGREKALKIGANVIMPNITPGMYRDEYDLYENKPCTTEEAVDCSNCLEARIAMAGDVIGYGEHGDPKHYYQRKV